jgi:YD repeat-containing protein
MPPRRSNEDFVGQDFHDAGFGSGRLVELTPEQRRARDEFRKEGTKEAGEAVRRVSESLAAPRKPGIWDYAAAAANIEAGTIRTPAQERAKRLGYELQPDGSLVSSKLAEAQKREQEYDGEGPTPEEQAAMERFLASDEEEESEESFWNDVEDDGNPSGGYASR